MAGNSLSFAQPYYLWLLVCLPLFVLIGQRSLTGLGRQRQWLAMALRGVVWLGLVVALAEPNWVRLSQGVTTLFVLDQSRSIPTAERAAMGEYVRSAVQAHRGQHDRTGVIVFGKNAAVEWPAWAEDFRPGRNLDTVREIDPQETDLAAAVRLALANFPSAAARRIVLVTDGNETRGNALEQAQLAADQGVGIDVVPVQYRHAGEVLIESVTLPPEMQRNQTSALRVVLNNTYPDRSVSGRLIISHSTGRESKVVFTAEQLQRLTLPPGKTLKTFPLQLAEPSFYRFEAVFVTDAAADDSQAQNNVGTAFTYVAGNTRLLLIENDDDDARGEHRFLVERLRSQGIEVDISGPTQAFSSLADLQPYDAVVLADVPKYQFSEAQLELLVQNTQDTGSGLIMLGGPHSFGAGGWSDSTLEKAMPVDFQVKNWQVHQIGALALVIDRSGSMSGVKLEMCKTAARATADVLQPRDYITVVAFDSAAQAIVPLTRMEAATGLARKISGISLGGGTDIYPGMELGYAQLKRTDPAVKLKHLILLTDGQTNPAQHVELARRMQRAGVSTTTIAVGADADQQLLNNIAVAGGGKFYHVGDARLLPKIFINEAKRVSRPAIHENANGFAPSVVGANVALTGFSGKLPPLTGFNLTTVKQSPLVEVGLLAPEPTGPDTEQNRTVLATWQYGLGRATAFTSDAGQRWGQAWSNWEGYTKFFTQLVRAAVRPSGDTGQFALQTNVREGRAQVLVTALNESGEFHNFQTLAATVIGPNGDAGQRVLLEQTAPGQYAADFATDSPGTYLVTILTGVNAAPLRAGINVPYSDEYRQTETNVALLQSLAAMQPAGGTAGKVLEPTLDPKQLSADVQPFRNTLRPASSSQPFWFWVAWLTSILFVVDVFNRRVAWSLSGLVSWAGQAWLWLRGKPQPAKSEYLERLSARKVRDDQQLAEQAARFEPRTTATVTAESQPTNDVLPTVVRPAVVKPVVPAAGLSPEREQGSYTARLLEAKRRALEERNAERKPE